MKGEFFALLAALCWGLCPIIEKKALELTDSPTAIFIKSLMDFIIISLIFTSTGKLMTMKIDYRVVIYLTLVSLIAGIIGQYFFYRGLSLSSPSKVVVISSIYPFVTIMLSTLILGKLPSTKVWIGAVLIFIGIFLVME